MTGSSPSSATWMIGSVSPRSTATSPCVRSTRGSSSGTRGRPVPEIGSRSSELDGMPLLDHFHPPLHGPRHWEGFLHAWATWIAQQLNQEALPPGYFAE